jgi:Mu transposase, C-terminal domain
MCSPAAASTRSPSSTAPLPVGYRSAAVRFIAPTGQVIAVSAKADRAALAPLPEQPHLVCAKPLRRVRKDCLISFQGSCYSVPTHLVPPGRRIELELRLPSWDSDTGQVRPESPDMPGRFGALHVRLMSGHADKQRPKLTPPPEASGLLLPLQRPVTHRDNPAGDCSRGSPVRARHGSIPAKRLNVYRSK